jgi:hypothetical protein
VRSASRVNATAAFSGPFVWVYKPSTPLIACMSRTIPEHLDAAIAIGDRPAQEGYRIIQRCWVAWMAATYA